MLKCPNLRNLVKAIPDGNCLQMFFIHPNWIIRSIFYSTNGNCCTHAKLCTFLSQCANVEQYLSASNMDTVGCGTESEMYAFAHWMKCNIYSFNPTSAHWMTIFPEVFDRGLSADVQQKSLYIVWTNNDHF